MDSKRSLYNDGLVNCGIATRIVHKKGGGGGAGGGSGMLSSKKNSKIRRSKSLHDSKRYSTRRPINDVLAVGSNNNNNDDDLIGWTPSMKTAISSGIPQQDNHRNNGYHDHQQHYGYRRHFSNNDYHHYQTNDNTNINNNNYYEKVDPVPVQWISKSKITSSGSQQQPQYGSFSSEISNISSRSLNNMKSSMDIAGAKQQQQQLPQKPTTILNMGNDYWPTQSNCSQSSLHRQFSGLSLLSNQNSSGHNGNGSQQSITSARISHNGRINDRDLLEWKSLLFNGDSDFCDYNDDDDDEEEEEEEEEEEYEYKYENYRKAKLEQQEKDEETTNYDVIDDDDDDRNDENDDDDDETNDLLTNGYNNNKNNGNRMRKSLAKMSDWASYSQSRRKQLKFSYKFYLLPHKTYPPRYLNNIADPRNPSYPNVNGRISVDQIHKPIHRILVLGYPSSGKTSLIKEFKTFISQHPESSFNPINIDELNDNRNLLVHFVEGDTFDEYLLQTSVVSYQPDVYLIMYSIDSRDSFENVKKTLIDLPKWDDVEEKVVILVANKCDLERSRCISRKEARDFACKNDCKFIELSCTLSHNINVLLQGIGAQIDLKRKQKQQQQQQLQQDKSQQSKGQQSSDPPSNHPSYKSGNSKLKRRQSFFQKILRKVAINKSKSCNNLNVL